MIKINPQILPNDNKPTAELFPHLFHKTEEFPFYKQTRDFFCYFDNNYNIIIETTITDKKEIQKSAFEFLKKQKSTLESNIKENKNKLNKIKKTLGA